MSDLVTRLRDVCCPDCVDGDSCGDCQAIHNAAKEIERLRKAERDLLTDVNRLTSAGLAELDKRRHAEHERDEFKTRWQRTIDELGRVIHVLAGTDDVAVAVNACQPYASDLARQVVKERDEARAKILAPGGWDERCRKAEAEVERLRVIILRSGLWKHAPCLLCGYNGQGYYQPETHECARLDSFLTKKD